MTGLNRKESDVTPSVILAVFLVLRFVQHLVERGLASLNRRHYLDPNNQKEAKRILNIDDTSMAKTLAYSQDKYRFGLISSWADIAVLTLFLLWGGLGHFEEWAQDLAKLTNGGDIVTGLWFFAILGLGSMLVSIPFELYHTFVLEEKHGFNKQTLKGYVSDKLKGILIGIILGAPVISAVLAIMSNTGQYWWALAWITLFVFSLLTVWLYPVLLAPLFNKFTPVTEGELRDKIYALAERINFRADGISIMDASKRSSHGNAYFTGVFGKKRIVLFDTLVKSMSTNEVVAVLAHELGHFKLHHVRWSLIRSFFVTGLTFYLLSLFLPIEDFYHAFAMDGISNYGALIVFSLWFAPVSFLMQPLNNFFSQRNEFSADAFAVKNVGNAKELYDALLKLRETSHVMPISHPMFAKVYLSHPPLLERLKVLGS
jgi:STE24 endopeptidase